MLPVIAQDPIPQALVSQPLDVIVAFGLIVCLLIGYQMAIKVVIPALQARIPTPKPATDFNGDRIDSWLEITRDLVRQIQRSVDNQNTIIKKMDELTTGVMTEIKASEMRITALISATSTCPIVKESNKTNEPNAVATPGQPVGTGGK